VNRPSERIEGPSSDDRKQGQTVLILSRPAAFFVKAVGLVAAVLLLALAFVFSLIVLAIFAAVVLVLLVYVWWVRKRGLRIAHSSHRH
jgi:hypothetical protein